MLPRLISLDFIYIIKVRSQKKKSIVYLDRKNISESYFLLFSPKRKFLKVKKKKKFITKSIFLRNNEFKKVAYQKLKALKFEILG